jgi:enamine deaminase RidA (YjgF/YER057c/UK114 family)
MAGQIPLIPSSLTLPSPPSIAYDTALSLQHIERVVEAAREGRWQGNCESAICWIADSDERSWRNTLEVARRGWASCDERASIYVSS